MSAYYALIVASVVFLIVAIMHLLRIIYRFEIKIAKKTVPIWVNGIAFIVALILSIWLFLVSKTFI